LSSIPGYHTWVISSHLGDPYHVKGTEAADPTFVWVLV